MLIYDFAPILKGMWTTEFSHEGRFVISILQCNDRIQTEDQARACAISELTQFNPKLEWDEVRVKFTSELSL